MTQDRKKIFKGNWNEILAVSYIVEARKRTSVIWLGKPIIILDQYGLPRGYYEPFPLDILTNIFNIIGTHTRECIISSSDDWIDFISDSCYSLNCENWTHVDGKKQTFLGWMTSAKIEDDSTYTFEREKFFLIM